jgi:hypothetical protein
MRSSSLKAGKSGSSGSAVRQRRKCRMSLRYPCTVAGARSARRRVSRNSASHGGSAADACISRIVTPRDRSPFIAGKMDADRAKAREILHVRHDFPQCRCKNQLLMANPSTCAGLRRNLAENPVPYRTIPHGWAFRPVVRGAAFQAAIASSVNHTVRLPRCRSASLYSDQFVTRRFGRGIWWRHCICAA